MQSLPSLTALLLVALVVAVHVSVASLGVRDAEAVGAAPLVVQAQRSAVALEGAGPEGAAHLALHGAQAAAAYRRRWCDLDIL